MKLPAALHHFDIKSRNLPVIHHWGRKDACRFLWRRIRNTRSSCSAAWYISIYIDIDVCMFFSSVEGTMQLAAKWWSDILVMDLTRFTWTVFSQMFSLFMPALFIRMSRRPNVSTVLWNASVQQKQRSVSEKMATGTVCFRVKQNCFIVSLERWNCKVHEILHRFLACSKNMQSQHMFCNDSQNKQHKIRHGWFFQMSIFILLRPLSTYWNVWDVNLNPFITEELWHWFHRVFFTFTPSSKIGFCSSFCLIKRTFSCSLNLIKLLWWYKYVLLTQFSLMVCGQLLLSLLHNEANLVSFGSICFLRLHCTLGK